ncbi:LysR family transcriptional regulator [Paracoccus nototheniae]|uniref:LysR family transcriptional regulator n=1 Tax=Paracoccus nototheniae TaxID=2489002 RepID=A0ABW4DZW3_9RHOB|nr:LysR family transcriptional regulator [Paracoccus nototheniae]
MNLNRLAHFVAVVDAGSFTRAAERLGITKAVVSQQVAQLERDLKTTLLVRTTRSVKPTEAGRVFHARCVQILRQADDAVAEMTAVQSAPSGTLRLTAPNDYGVAVVVPTVAAFAARFPACKVDLRLDDRTLDLMQGDIDMAIRVGWLIDSGLQARRIGGFRQLLVGDPSRVAALGPITGPADLRDAAFIANLALKKPLSFMFSHPGHPPVEVSFTSAVAIDSTLGVLEATVQGGGLSVLPDYMAQPRIAAGALVRVLPDWSLAAGGIHTVFPQSRYRPAKVAAFLEMLQSAERTRARLSDSEV